MQAGIVGLPNVGKSTLFNAVTRTRKAEAANYPFCTIEPNVGIVQVPDSRLEPLAKIAKTGKIIPAAIEFVDIAGLVAGASKGEGLGNKFLANIRQVDAIIEVVRCFEDEDIIHNMGSVDPVRDIEIITTELVLADLQSVDNQIERQSRKAKGQDKEGKEAAANVVLLEKVREHLNEGKPANVMDLPDEDRARIKQFFLLTTKPVIFACNVLEDDVADPSANPFVKAVEDYVKAHHDAASCVICSKLEEELSEMDQAEADDFLKELGVEDSGAGQLIRATYDLLGLASYFTAGEKEARAWTFHKGMKAPECAGVIHTDFQDGFIKAEVVAYADLLSAGSKAAARDAGKLRIEGKEYVFKDGDVVEFRFNKTS
ncbi:redox-regulated ATPase YchF [Puniceicoccales bacterium CK1056]|uniref:Ribosome-binding ATPase YchF n=1 Tax=Oceanipulchritudo coccoides TaxID=2706888 RepID=A0A6B2M2R7_9BACT|nr:redox-regulated ATPase YchF [Oceanipulchritudo coccoides]NDV63311.1 redox-regulated ATPase YchF [Oceanipulchritudo coccoides]